MSRCIADIQALLDLFEGKAPDDVSNPWLRSLLMINLGGYKANGLFTTIRDRNLKAIKDGNKDKESQYYFEEVCAKPCITSLGLARHLIPMHHIGLSSMHRYW